MAQFAGARTTQSCLFCGEPIEPTAVDPCSAVLTAAPRAGEPEPARGRGARAKWWRRPPGVYWMHAACLRRAAHPSVALAFLDLAEGGHGGGLPS